MSEHEGQEIEKVEVPAPSKPDDGRGTNFTPKSDFRGFSRDMHHVQWEKKLNQHMRRLERAGSRAK